MSLDRIGLERAADAIDNHAATCAWDGWECCAEAAITAYLAWMDGDDQ